MALLKCKMCGGDLEISEGMSVCECEYCGTKQTVPSADDEKEMTLFNRANRLRFNCEFDKASGVYESIVADFPEEAEAYWGLVLCKYGIEYVDDPATAKKIPTCHRSSFESVMDDANFEQVMENADSVARGVYREEAKQIEELRKGIIEVSSKEEPYDIFICYKEADDNGDRTVDSVIAQDVYNALTEKGYKVFFSRITLEDKLGQEYEPYIFAALNSAKVMLAFGTNYEYYNAVWVKNEWSRFLQLIAKGEKKTLIPCYKNIDAYDMPKEFAKLQAQDMGKVGAVQDLLRGIEKILPKGGNKTTVEVNSNTAVAHQSATTDSLLERAFMFLEDGNWREANRYCDRVLDQEPQNVRAYLGKLMAEMCVEKQEHLRNCEELFDNSKNYQRILRLGDSELISTLQEYISYICERKENERRIQQKRVEEIKETANNVAKAIRFHFESIPSVERLATLQDKAVKLQELLAKFPAILSQISCFIKETATLENQIKELQNYKLKLNIFKKKEKLETDKKIVTLANHKRVLQKELSNLKEEIKDYSSIEHLQDCVNSTKKEVSNLQAALYSTEQKYTYEEALNLFHNNADVKAELTENYYGIIMLMTNIGECFRLGRFPQTYSEDDPIEWQVLAKEDEQLLVISKFILYRAPYNDKKHSWTRNWYSSSLRNWLNSTFYDYAFSSEEKHMIIKTQIDEYEYRYDGQARPESLKTTHDKVFLLSRVEAEKYFKEDESRVCRTTSACDSGTDSLSWWLRSPIPEWFEGTPATVQHDGSIDTAFCHYPGVGVRPAMWIDPLKLS